MRKLSIFDDSVLIATITAIDNSIFIFARSSREYSEMKRLTGYINSNDKNYLEKFAKQVHEFNYSTEFADK